MSTESLAQILDGQPLVLADVGASYFIPDTWNYLLSLSTARFVLFDPVGKNLEYAKLLPSERVTVVPFALSRNGEVSEFFLAKTDSGSSLFPPHPWPSRPPLNHDYFFPLKIIDIETKTMTSCLNEQGIDSVHAIKLDTQGSELDIIKGLDAARLEKLLLVEMEVSLDSYPVMLGAARLPEVINYFEGNGFRHINTRIARKSLDQSGCVGPGFGATLAAQHECDVLFVKDILNAPHADTKEFISVLRQQLTLLCIYYLHAEAIETVRLAAQTVPAARDLLAALERFIAGFARYQSARLKEGAQSLWHRDQT
jgi:FkbM family methyltransferase